MVRYEKLFESFFIGGFECSTHYLESGKRLDEIAATQHDRFAAADYLRLKRQGIRTAREGIRWHLIEQQPGRYDFSSALEMIRAAREMGIQVIWDLCHYGWPDWLDIFQPRFVSSFEKLAREFARILRDEGEEVPYICPINEISFFAWGGGDSAWLNPYARGRGDELKDQLVRASIAAIEAVWEINPRTRITQIDPIINVLPENPDDAKQCQDAENYRQSQYAAFDMLAGQFKPHLGGKKEYLDLIGVNYYVHNQWILGGSFIEPTNPRYRPFSEMIKEFYERYERPLFIAETGIEDHARPTWFRYVCTEVRAAIRAGAQVEGICLYPIVNHPGWVDDRHCYNGLWDYANDVGEREIYEPLARELQRQRRFFERLLKPSDVDQTRGRTRRKELMQT
jgi:beta-glucosidase/6-phospho-beta-glucosidase/beta-galactosidase